jgi:hypothetical protein
MTHLRAHRRRRRGHSPSRWRAAARAQSTSAASAAAPGANLQAAERPSAGLFLSANGKTLQQLGNLASAQAQLGAATCVFTPGTSPVAFGPNTSSGAFIYCRQPAHLDPRERLRAMAVLAPADRMGVARQYRSQQNAGPGGIQASYSANVPVPRAGAYTILALTRVPGALLGSLGEIAVAPSSSIPDVGQRPPDISTDTAPSVSGRLC